MNNRPLKDDELHELITSLRNVNFFKPFTVAELDKLLPHFEIHSYKPGERIFKKGDKGDAFYLIHRGLLSVQIKKGFFSSPQTVAALKPGQFFGEMALLDHSLRTATVCADEPSELFVLFRQYFDFVVQENPSFKEQIHQLAQARQSPDSR